MKFSKSFPIKVTKEKGGVILLAPLMRADFHPLSLFFLGSVPAAAARGDCWVSILGCLPLTPKALRDPDGYLFSFRFGFFQLHFLCPCLLQLITRISLLWCSLLCFEVLSVAALPCEILNGAFECLSLTSALGTLAFYTFLTLTG